MAVEGSSYSAGRRDTLAAALARAVARYPDEIFFDFEGEAIGYAELDRQTTRFGNALKALGVGKGDRIVTIYETHADTVVAFLTAAKIGAIWCPINLAYRREFLRHQIADTGARIILCDSDYIERVTEIADQLPELKLILCRGDMSHLPACSVPIESLEAYRGSDDTPIDVKVDPADLVALIYTSGTTGPSKGCMISHNYFCMQGRQQERSVGLEPGVVTWTPLPLFHSAALTALVGTLVVGSRLSLSRNFSVSSFWDDVERSGASRVFLMASAFGLVAHAPDTPAMKRCFGQVKVLQGVPITPEIKTIWEERFGVQYVLTGMYGQTEVNRLTFMPLGEESPDYSIGKVAEEFEVAILDDEDRPVGINAVGQLCCRPKFPNVIFEGYWNRPDETAKAWRNLWMHTGDLAKMDENGFLYFVDRAKDYLRCRGENISSFEVESSFLTHPDILEAALHAAGATITEDDIKITLVLKEGATVTEHELCLWAIDALPHFAVPRFYEYRSELPKNPTGRVLKYVLRDEGVTARTWDRESVGIQVRRQKPVRRSEKVA